MPSQRRAPLTSLPNKKKKAEKQAPGATANLKKAKKGENNAEIVAEGANGTATRATRSRAPGKAAEGSTPKPETGTKKAGKGAAGSSKPKAAKEEAENDKRVPVYCGEGKLKVLGTYDVDTTTVICKKASLGTVQPEAFCYMAGLRTKDWMKNILVQGDGEGRNLADWLNQSCEHCKSPGHEDKMLICDNDACQKHWHIFCLRPKLMVLPGEEEQWFCPECVAK